ncbi:NAD(P)H-dependent oxidoreductase [Dyella choica]|uniref:Flavodoxin family protein n=1 Tax=Dyella choica TaxID=1927959 RepID=A0A432M911_9GAMM|nr:NAD(P)H-dependent oxidoreductase [Dyella choica]RUL78364.1 flavodoxin family protein [Dyella choica]
MKCLVVVAHPLSASLCQTMARSVVDTLSAAGHTVVVEDLYGSSFSPALTPDERSSYYEPSFDAASIHAQAERLVDADALVLVFPTWWFGFPAVLKGWFDRVWAPGIAYDHASDFGPIQARLRKLRKVCAITSLGSPWWVDRLVLRQPVKRILKTALLGTCAPACDFKMLSLYRAERLSAAQVQAFSARIQATLCKWM